MKKYYFFLSFFIAAIGMSCSNQEDNILDENKEQHESLTYSSGDGKYDLLGYGYDVTGEYLNPESVRGKVLDIESFVSNNPSRFDSHFAGITTTRIYGGDNFASYTKEIQKESGIATSAWIRTSLLKDVEKSTFSGEMSKKYSSKYSISSKYSFARGEFVKKQRQYIIDATASTLSNYLSYNFNQDLQILSANDIVNKYGTHVLINIEVGGMLRAYFRSVITEETNSSIKTKAAKGGLALNLNNFGISVNGSGSMTESIAYANKNSSWEFTLDMIGGNTNGYSFTITSENPNPNHTVNVGTWMSSVDDAHCKLVNINWDVTYPIYDFISDPTKKAQIKAAVERYIISKKVEVLELFPLYRMYGGRSDTHYETSWSEVQRWINNGHDYEGLMGYILKYNGTNTLPFYRMWRKGDTHYETSWSEVQRWINNGHNYEGLMGYILKYNDANTLPLYRMYKKGDTHYETSWSEVQRWINDGHDYECFMGFIYSAD